MRIASFVGGVAVMWASWVMAAGAEPLTFGTRMIDVPAPQGFKAVGKTMPKFIEISEGYLPASNRLVEAYLLPDDEQTMLSGGNVDIRRYFQLQTLRALDGRPLSNDEFREVTATIEKQLGSLIAAANEQADALSKAGNAAAEKSAGINPELSIDGMQFVGTFRREPWGLFFTTRARLTVDGEVTITTGSAAVSLINHQVMYLYAYTYDDEDGPFGRSWTERAVSEWADAVHAANPDEASVTAQAEAAKPQSKFLKTTITGAVIGGLAGLVGAIVAKRRKKA